MQDGKIYKLKPLTSIYTINAAQDVVDFCFQGNSLLDNAVYSIYIDFNMPDFGDFVHKNISHNLPVLADDITDFGILRGDRFYRNALNANNNSWETLGEMFEEIYRYFLELENKVSNLISIAAENADYQYEDFSRDFNFSKLAPYTKQVMTFLQAIKSYESGDNILIPSWNKDFKSYIILSEGN